MNSQTFIVPFIFECCNMYSMYNTDSIKLINPNTDLYSSLTHSVLMYHVCSSNKMHYMMSRGDFIFLLWLRLFIPCFCSDTAHLNMACMVLVHKCFPPILCLMSFMSLPDVLTVYFTIHHLHAGASKLHPYFCTFSAVNIISVAEVRFSTLVV